MTVVVNSIIQKDVPVARINKPVKLNFDFNTNGKPEDKGARIEARVISDGVITDMYSPAGSKLTIAVDKKIAFVTSISEKSGGWRVNRHITLQFDSLPKGNGEYIVGTLYYYNADDIIGIGIPLLVNLTDD